MRNQAPLMTSLPYAGALKRPSPWTQAGLFLAVVKVVRVVRRVRRVGIGTCMVTLTVYKSWEWN